MSPRRRRSGGPPRQVVVIAAIAAVVLGGLWILLSTGGGARDAEAAGPVIDDPTVSESELALATGRSTSTGGSTRAIMPPVEREPRETSTRSNNDNTGSGTGGTASSLGDALRNGGRQEPEARVVNTGVETQTPRQTPNETTQTTQPMRAGGGRVAELVSAAAEQIEGDEPIVARELLNRALATPGIEPAESVRVRTMLSALNRQLVFGPTIFEGDPMTEAYEVQSGDSLARIARRRELATDWRLVQRVNELSNPNRIRVGQTLKLVRGPFHAVVDKRSYRLDLFWGPPGDRDSWKYVLSADVGLGEDDSTPTGSFRVRKGSKLVNPYWVNPRTGEAFDADDPENPIGERWIGIEGLGDDAEKTGYGLHGTIEPDSIGRQQSMGCVRLRDADVELVYELLVEGLSRVVIED